MDMRAWYEQLQREAEGAAPLATSAYAPPTAPTGAPTPVVLPQAQRGAQSFMRSMADAATLPRDAYQGTFQTQPSAMTDADFERANNFAGMVGSGGFAMAKPEGALGMFAGRQAKTADQMALLTANVGEHAGHSADAIYKNTGWYRGVDDRWKYEIPDDKSVLDLSGVKKVATNSDEVTIGDILKHDELFKAYPDLKDISVRNIPDQKGAWYGQTVHGDERIGLNLQNSDSSNAHSMLLHELQHAIQRREGFAKGANINMPEITQAQPIMAAQAELDRLKSIGREFSPESKKVQTDLHSMKWEPYSRAAGEVEARAVQARQWYSPERRMEMTPLAWESQPQSYTGRYNVPPEKQWIPGKTRPFLDEYYGD